MPCISKIPVLEGRLLFHFSCGFGNAFSRIVSTGCVFIVVTVLNPSIVITDDSSDIVITHRIRYCNFTGGVTKINICIFPFGIKFVTSSNQAANIIKSDNFPFSIGISDKPTVFSNQPPVSTPDAQTSPVA